MTRYDGPGEYEVRVRFNASATLTIEATSRQEAEDKAAEMAIPDDFDVDDTDVILVTPFAADDPRCESSGDIFERLTGVELAYWAFTGNMAPGALDRIKAEDRLLEVTR